MLHGLGGLLILGAIAALATVAGGLLLTTAGAHRNDDRILKFLVALGAGFMLAAIFIEIVPETVTLWVGQDKGEAAGTAMIVPMALLLGGYFVVHFFEHTLAPHFHFGQETHPEALIRRSAAYSALIGLLIHTFFDGVSIAAAYLVDVKVGLLVFIAILLHKIPEGFTVSSIMLASGRSPRKAMWAAIYLGLATFAGVVFIQVLSIRITASVAVALPISAGVTLYVAASDLIPEVNHRSERNPLIPVVVFVGVALFYLLHRLIEG
ncbi:MAG: ZIP family metal transporter [Pyrinomonadaceae bacterium]